MTVCQYCDKQEIEACRFTLPFTCNECENDEKNYCDSNVKDDITFISANGRYVTIDTNTEIEINKEELYDDNLNYKDALLSSLYSQVELLRNQLKEKDILLQKQLELLK